MAELDRVVTLRLFDMGHLRRETTNTLPGEPTDHVVWAKRSDSQVDRQDTSGSIRTINVRTFRLRWRADVVLFDPSLLVIQEDDRGYQVTDVTEPDPRNRWMDIEVSRELV